MKTRLFCLVLLIVGFSYGCRSKNVSSSGIINIDGIELSYTTEGTGRQCLIYGIPQYQMKAFSSTFKSHFQCIFIDCRFNDTSALVDTLSPFTIEAAVEEIEAIREALKLNKFILVGHSVLGIVVLEYTQHYPQYLSHVIAIGTMPEISKDQSILASNFWNDSASVKRKEWLNRNWVKLTKDSLSKLDPADAFIARVIANAPRRSFDSTFNEGRLLAGQKYNIPVLNQLFGQDFYLLKDSIEIKPPVFLAMGKYDYGCPYFDWYKHLDMFNDITFQLFDYSGHVPHAEEADKFDSLVIGWIEKK